MQIAVATETDDPDASVSYYGGRAAYYLIFDECGNHTDSLRNPYAGIDRHAGYELSRLLIDRGVDAVIAGLFGPTMLERFSGAGVRCAVKRGTARKAVEEFVLLSG